MQEIGLDIILVLCRLASCDPPDLVIFLLIHIYARNRNGHNIGAMQVDPPDPVISHIIRMYARNKIGHNIGTVQVALL
jgi:hypothetical protein